jgi:hypothetical protein
MTPSQSQTDETAAAARVHRFPLRYKTALCVNFTTKGSCPRGQACLYAHGEGELRTTAENRIPQSPSAAKPSTTPARTDLVLEEVRIHRSAASAAASATLRREPCLQLSCQAPPASNAPTSSPLQCSRAHGAPHRNPYSAVNLISLVPDCGE